LKKKDETWYENDKLWDKAFPALFGRYQWLQAEIDTMSINNLLGLKPPLKILDLCCGVGRYSLPFAKMGNEVTGVDRTDQYLKQAKERAKSENFNIEFLNSDIRTFIKPDYFDLAVNLSTSFGYFENPDDDRLVISNIYKSLKPGGIFLIELLSKEVTFNNFRDKYWYNQDYGYLLEERFPNKNWTWIDLRWTMVTNTGKNNSIEFSYRLYSADELSDLLHDAGFRMIQVFGDFLGKKFDHHSDKLVIIGKKPKNSAGNKLE
jgi:ubiquinone/menaquinone biosynthesis C-methylase UbiE